MAVPSITLVAGPPCAGKTTYALGQLADDDMIVDVDLLTRALTGRHLHDRSKGVAPYVFAARDTVMGMISAESDIQKIFVTACLPKAKDRQDFVEKYQAKSILILPSQDECISRLAADTARPESIREELSSAIEKWFDAYTPWAGDEIVSPEIKARAARLRHLEVERLRVI